MTYFSERDFLLACGNHTRQLWAEYYLEYALSEDEAWRLASHEFFREKLEQRLVDELGFSAIDLRQAQVAAVARLPFNHRLQVVGSGYAVPNSRLVDQPASHWMDWTEVSLQQ